MPPGPSAVVCDMDSCHNIVSPVCSRYPLMLQLGVLFLSWHQATRSPWVDWNNVSKVYSGDNNNKLTQLGIEPGAFRDTHTHTHTHMYTHTHTHTHTYKHTHPCMLAHVRACMHTYSKINNLELQQHSLQIFLRRQCSEVIRIVTQSIH